MIDRIKNEVRILSLIDGGTHKIGVDKYRANTCPLCGGRDHFTIFDDTNTYSSFSGCCNGGSVIDFMVEVKGYKTKEAIKYLETLVPGGVVSQPKQVQKSIAPIPNKEEPIAPIYDFNHLVNRLHNQCKDGVGRSYFECRGLSKTLCLYKLGYDEKGYNGAFSEFKNLQYNHSNAMAFKYFIPFYDVEGNVTYILSRHDGSIADKQKTRNLKGLPIRLFNDRYLMDHNAPVKEELEPIFICEGWADALSFEEIGYKAIAINSVANANKLLQLVRNNLKNCKNKVFIIALDNDTAGETAIKKIVTDLKALNLAVTTFPIPLDYKDINEFLVNQKDEFERLTKEFINDILSQKANKLNDSKAEENMENKGLNDKKVNFNEEQTYIFLHIEDEIEKTIKYNALREEAKKRKETKLFDSMVKAIEKKIKQELKKRAKAEAEAKEREEAKAKEEVEAKAKAEAEAKARERERKSSELPAYMYINNWGNISVNTSLLAEHIRTNSNYYIVKKQGSDSSFTYWYEDGYYKEISSNELKSKIKQFIPLDIRKPSHWEDTYKDLITTDNFISFEEMNNDKYYINFKNGLLNTRTWEVEEHNPKLNHTFQIKGSYDPSNPAPAPTTWLKFIETLSNGDKEIQDTLQEWFGLNISNYNANICKKAVALYGKVGNTGKTKYLTMLSKVIGIENICSKAIQDFTSTFGTGSLYGTKCVAIDDQKGTNIEDGSDFKAITGMGLLEVRMKFKEPFPIEYKGGITFTCNNMPYIKDDKGTHMFERMLIIPCDNVIPEEKRDKQLLDKLENEVDGIIAWALEGLKRLINNNFKLTEGQASKQANDEYRALNDTLFRFISENCITTGDKKDRIKKTDFEARYDKYCISNDLTGLDKKNIKDRAEQNGIMFGKYEGIFYYQGIKYID